MSVVIRMPDGTIKVLVKGADNLILSILDVKDDMTAKIRQA